MVVHLGRIYIKFEVKVTLVNIGRSRGRCQHVPPQQDPFLSFLHTFLPKSVRVEGWHPRNGLVPPQREILDPPLVK